MQYYGNKISEHMADTPEGYLICYDVPINRTGVQEYIENEIGFQGDKIVKVNRKPDDVFSSETLASFEGKPITDGHPVEPVNSSNYQVYSKGHTQNIRKSGEYTIADLLIQDPILISEIKSGLKREISCGYQCDFQEENGEICQKNIVGNHIAVVTQGRAGDKVAIKDQKTKMKGVAKMATKKKNFLKSFFEVYDELPEEEANAENDVKDEENGEEKAAIQALLDKLDAMEKRISELETGKEEKTDDVFDEFINGEPEESERVKIVKTMRPVIAEIEDECTRKKLSDALLSCFKGKESKDSDILKATEEKAKAMNDSKNNMRNILEEQKKAYDARNPHKKGE